ncbi:hypothetical protein KUC3_37800 [Alteromonas sp. KC3]|nr:hypothetical protein KUC3_37800 [Alteromonas sp. KC3]BCO24893.1 hypothetical protein KUC14_37620 [Alteromonas sp. KC14]
MKSGCVTTSLYDSASRAAELYRENGLSANTTFYIRKVFMLKAKEVRVCAYTRRRAGRLEYVCSHTRSLPNR